MVMKIFGTIVGVVLVLLGGLWTLQGSNMLAGSAMSGQSQWLYIGLIVVVVGLVVLWWFTLRRRMR
jgi:protein-S-isoprenylcysteine O-methyltransferase Ste14